MHTGDLHAETEEPKTEHQIMITWLCCLRKSSWIFIWSLERKKESRGSEAEALCVSLGEVDTKTVQHRLELQHGPYGCYSLHPLFSKTKCFFKWLWAHRPGTHTHSLSLFYCTVWLVCVSWLRFCHRTFTLISHCDRQIYVHRALQQLFISCHSNGVRAAVVVLIECEINLAHTFFFVLNQLIMP